MKRDNPKYPPWHCFTACKCEKCGEMYEADREHICRKKNSYPMRVPKSTAHDNKCVVCGEIIPEGRQVCPKCEGG